MRDCRQRISAFLKKAMINAKGFLHPKFLSADLTRPRNHRPKPSVIYGLRFNLLVVLQANREHL